MYYFAYGSNMSKKQMQDRCGQGKFKFLKRAYLKGYRFVYDGYSSYRSGAVANIVKDENCTVWGALYEVDKDCLDKLDQYEGYPDIYQREILQVEDDNGKRYEAWVYLRDPKEEGMPSEEYKQIVIQGAKDCDLPEDYIKKFIMQKE